MARTAGRLWAGCHTDRYTDVADGYHARAAHRDTIAADG
jgi:hypothetical protein